MMHAPHRALASAAILVAATLTLCACQYLPNVALRLNSDGTVDFGSCDKPVVVGLVDAKAYIRTDDENTATQLTVQETPATISSGDVIHLGPTPPQEEWDRISVSISGTKASTIRGVWGIFDARQLSVGEWSWAKNSSMYEDVEHCELDG
ncbi:hypothetical protein FHX49_001818 [Microbacterium endophyticum]|uniref:Lipoprotein n=1 Tax=Microbacterium endophyticum TaxID=1526412 RepID=A0A7W4V3W3_9MICO|nr:hypothetical protein [Microbacterium endophyticum]MBB2976244.1 hypothetical protein [Microbacterium endophyticum]NIK35124.1 hypothetical protein [Microbacterium endophyticum]